MIKQILNVPDSLIPVRRVAHGDEKYWEDTILAGIPVFMALTGEDEVVPYIIDGTGRLDPAISFRPAFHCPKCGQRMWVKPHDEPSDLEYECICGTARRIAV